MRVWPVALMTLSLSAQALVIPPCQRLDGLTLDDDLQAWQLSKLTALKQLAAQAREYTRIQGHFPSGHTALIDMIKLTGRPQALRGDLLSFSGTSVTVSAKCELDANVYGISYQYCWVSVFQPDQAVCEITTDKEMIYRN